MTPSATIAAIDADGRRAEVGRAEAREFEEGDLPLPAAAAERADRDDLQDEVAGARHDERDRRRRSGSHARGSRNSPEMCVPTSQPANAQTKRLIAVPTPAQP